MPYKTQRKMQWNKRGLYFPDLVLLRMIHDYCQAGKRSFNASILRSEWPKQVEAFNADYIKPARSGNAYTTTISMLRLLNLLEDRKRYRLSDEGRALIARIGDDWRQWPVFIPVNDFNIDWDHAIYIEEGKYDNTDGE